MYINWIAVGYLDIDWVAEDNYRRQFSQITCKKRDSKMRVLAQTTTFLPLLWCACANAVDQN